MKIFCTIIIFLSFIAFSVYIFGVLAASRFFYYPQLWFHYIHERKLYEHFKAALQQIKDKGPLVLYPLTYWVQYDVRKDYLKDGKYANTYHLIFINGHVSLYKGDVLIMTDFSRLLIQKLIDESGITEKNVKLLTLIEYRADKLGYPNFMSKYFGTGWYTNPPTYKQFLTTFVEKDEQCVLLKTNK